MRLHLQQLSMAAVVLVLAACSSPTPAASPTAPAAAVATTAPAAAASPKPAAAASPASAASPVAAASPVSATNPAPAASGPASGQPVKIGLSAAFSGPTAYLGQSAQNAVQMAVDDYNARGGFKGRPIQIVTEDNQNQPSAAVTSVTRLIDSDGVLAVLGELGSSVTIAAMPIFLEKKIPNIAYVDTNAKIYDMMGVGGNPWVFRINADDSTMSTPFAALAQQAHKSYAIIAQNDDFGRGATAIYQPLFQKAGVQVTSTSYYDVGTADFRPILSKVKAENPEGIFYIGLANDGAVLMHQYQELGLTQPILSRGALATNEFIDRIKDIPHVADGVQEAIVWTPGEDLEMEARYQQKYGQPIVVHGAMAYYAWQVLQRALDAAPSAEPQAIRDAIANVDFTLPGLGPIKFDDHNQAYPNMALAGIQNGQIQFDKVLPTSKNPT
jgi:branched-chain amino acid transport system substrate-binding protein